MLEDLLKPCVWWNLSPSLAIQAKEPVQSPGSPLERGLRWTDRLLAAPRQVQGPLQPDPGEWRAVDQALASTQPAGKALIPWEASHVLPALPRLFVVMRCPLMFV